MPEEKIIRLGESKVEIKPTGKELIAEQKKIEILENSKISLWIDSFNEIFSDFDPRPYSKRELSTDFLMEAKRFARENLKGNFDLVILMPTNLRDLKNETIIKKRIKEHFQTQLKYLKKKRKEILTRGLGFISLGVIFMIITTFILFAIANPNFLIIFLGVIGEPAGWFLFWEGLNLTIFDSNERKSDLDFNLKMSKVNIVFDSIE